MVSQFRGQGQGRSPEVLMLCVRVLDALRHLRRHPHVLFNLVRVETGERNLGKLLDRSDDVGGALWRGRRGEAV